VLVACRPEEFHRAISPGLGQAFERAKLQGPRAPFAGGDEDEDGRVRARAIEAGLRPSSKDVIEALARLALSMGHVRTTRLPISATLMADEGAYRDGPLLVRGSEGEHRFVHDIAGPSPGQVTDLAPT
jgi:hypothetical protein